MHWNRYKNLGSTIILTVLILPPNDNGNKFHCSRSVFTQVFKFILTFIKG